MKKQKSKMWYLALVLMSSIELWFITMQAATCIANNSVFVKMKTETWVVILFTMLSYKS